MKLLERKRFGIIGIGLHSSGSIRYKVMFFCYDGVIIDDVLGLTVNRLKLAHIFYFTTIIANAAGVGKLVRMLGQRWHKIFGNLKGGRKEKAWVAVVQSDFPPHLFFCCFSVPFSNPFRSKQLPTPPPKIQAPLPLKIPSHILRPDCSFNRMDYGDFILNSTYRGQADMKAILFLLALLFLTSSKLVFEDNFDFLDFDKWRHDITLAGGGNWEFQIYDNNRTTTFTKDGKLNIKPVLTQDKIGAQFVRAGYTYELWGGSPADQCTGAFFYGCSRTSDGNHYINPVMSGKLTTVNSFTFQYGRVEVKAKLPKGDWLWPAIWALPRNNEYGEWPASGEIDIMESRGNVGYPREFGGGPETFGSTMHWGADYFTNQYTKTHAEKSASGGSFADDFHTYGLYWDDKVIYTYLDDDSNRVLQVDHSQQTYWEKSGINNRYNPWQYSKNKNAPFDRPFYLILNLAVGGTAGYFKDGVAAKPWSDQSQRASSEFYDNKGQWWPTWGDQSAFQIDSVKVWDLSPNTPEEEPESVRKVNLAKS